VSAPGTTPASAGSTAALFWDGRLLSILDQTLLPFEERWLELSDGDEVAAALRRLAVRGAPLIGIASAYGMAMAATHTDSEEELRAAAERLRAARPTAANLGWAVDRVLAAALAASRSERGASARAEAQALHAEEDAAGAAVGARGADLLEAAGAERLLTHCNTGVLACGARGSALGVVAALAERRPVSVLTCETRPLLQGARLTVWELRRLGLPHELIVDSAAAGLIRRGEVDAVVVGFDRAAANGDVANKVGTYGLALAAAAAGIPFVVAGPTSSIDGKLASGDDIVIEERDPDEVRQAGGAPLTLSDTPCRNPAFDVTPAGLVGALVTEVGVARPVTRKTVAALLR